MFVSALFAQAFSLQSFDCLQGACRLNAFFRRFYNRIEGKKSSRPLTFVTNDFNVTVRLVATASRHDHTQGVQRCRFLN